MAVASLCGSGYECICTTSFFVVLKSTLPSQSISWAIAIASYLWSVSFNGKCVKPVYRLSLSDVEASRERSWRCSSQRSLTFFPQRQAKPVPFAAAILIYKTVTSLGTILAMLIGKKRASSMCESKHTHHRLLTMVWLARVGPFVTSIYRFIIHHSQDGNDRTLSSLSTSSSIGRRRWGCL